MESGVDGSRDAQRSYKSGSWRVVDYLAQSCDQRMAKLTWTSASRGTCEALAYDLTWLSCDLSVGNLRFRVGSKHRSTSLFIDGYVTADEGEALLKWRHECQPQATKRLIGKVHKNSIAAVKKNQ